MGILPELFNRRKTSLDGVRGDAIRASEGASGLLNEDKTRTFAVDAAGHAHKGKGPGGGQFVKGDGGSSGDGKSSSSKAKAKSKAATPTHAEPDPDANRPSTKPNRHKGNAPKVLAWKPPPPPQGVKGGGKVIRPKGSQSQTALGDKAEAATTALGFRNILPPGRRMNKSVAKEGSSIDVEFDHSGRAYEVKMCKTTAIEYRAKPKPDEIEGKIRFAEMHDLQPYTMIAVMDQSKGEIHYYASKEPGITTKKLSEDHFDYVGTAKFAG